MKTGATRWSAASWLAHPVTLAALVLLLVNDHVLKAAYPGLVTGKLSDVAGLVVAPPLLAMLTVPLLRRWGAPLAVALVGVGFAAVKALPEAAGVASVAWSVLKGQSLVRADLTDLVALPALGLAWYAWSRSRHRPSPGRVERAARLAVLLPLALFGVVASTDDGLYLPVASGVGPGVGRDTVILVGRNGVAATSPNGQDWSLTREVAGESPPDYDPAAVSWARGRHPVSCTSDRDCFRVVPDRLAIESSRDAGTTWTMAWSIPDRVRERYVRVFTAKARWDDGYAGDVRSDLTCTTLYSVPGSSRVTAACGLLGFVSGGAGGDWSMIGFGGGWSMLGLGNGLPAFDDPTPTEIGRQYMVLMLGWFVLLGGAELYAVTRRRRPRPLKSKWPAIPMPLARQLKAVAPSLAAIPLLAEYPTRRPWQIRAAVGFVASLPMLLVIRINDGEIVPRYYGQMLLLCTLAVGAVWFIRYVVDVRRFPWWAVPFAVAVPVLDRWLLDRMIDADIDWAQGWVAIWSIAGAGLAASIALGLLVARWRPAGVQVQAITSRPWDKSA